MFWIRSGCSGLVEVVLGFGAGFLDKVRIYLIVCGCSGKGEVVLYSVLVFRLRFVCSGVRAGVLGWVQVFWVW